MNEKIKQPMPKPGFNVTYNCQYESELDRQIIIDSSGHYIEDVIGTLDFVFIKVPMDAINKVFKVDPMMPGEEIEFMLDHKQNNIVRNNTFVNDDLPPLWSVLVNEETGLRIITTIEPCKFILRSDQLSTFETLMSKVEIAPKEYDYSALDLVYWNDVTRDLRRDIEFFAKGKKLFDSRDLAYSRSYLLHGPPGNGKTTTIKAISRFLGTKPESFDFSASMTNPDSLFKSWVLGDSERIAREEQEGQEGTENHVPIRLLVIEDIDRLFPRNATERFTTVTLQAVLQALDGAVERRNMIIIATANHPKELDQQVLARPGRFDKQIFYESPSVDDAFLYLKKLFHDELITDDTLRDVCKRLNGHSYALYKELFTTAASYASLRSSIEINDEDLMSSYGDIDRHINNVTMKSVDKGLGF